MLESMEKELLKGLPSGAVSKRKQGGFAVSYVEGHYVIEQANRIFGFDGWQSALKDLQIFENEKGYEAVATVQLRVDCRENEWIVRTDVGTGSSSLKMGRDKACKEAVTDAMKRAFRTFGNRFGNSLYDKDNPVHKGKEDNHGEEERYDNEQSGQVMQQFLHDLVNCHDLEGWKKVCAFYKQDIQKLSKEDQEKMRTSALDRKQHIEKMQKEGD